LKLTTEDDKGARLIERYFGGLIKDILQFSWFKKLPFLQVGIPKALRTIWVFLCYNKDGKNFPGDRGKELQNNFPEDH